MNATLVITLTAVALGCIRGLVIWLLAGEVKGATAAYFAHRVRKAARRLPGELAADYEEEWLAEVAALNDRPIRAFLFVHGLSRATSSIDSQAWEAARREVGSVALFWMAIFESDVVIWLAMWNRGWWVSKARRAEAATWLRATAGLANLSPLARHWAIGQAVELERGLMRALNRTSAERY